MDDPWEEIHHAVADPDNYEVLWHCICDGPQVWSVREILKKTEHQPGTAAERLSGYIAVHWGTLTSAAQPVGPGRGRPGRTIRTLRIAAQQGPVVVGEPDCDGDTVTPEPVPQRGKDGGQP